MTGREQGRRDQGTVGDLLAGASASLHKSGVADCPACGGRMTDDGALGRCGDCGASLGDGEPGAGTAEELTESRRFALEGAEATIERGVRAAVEAYVEVGGALAEIRDERLYREEGYATFDEYCRERWGFSRFRAHRVIHGARAAEMLPTGNRPPNERQARELVPLASDEAAVVETWEELRREHGPRLTTDKVRDAVRRRLRSERKKQARSGRKGARRADGEADGPPPSGLPKAPAPPRPPEDDPPTAPEERPGGRDRTSRLEERRPERVHVAELPTGPFGVVLADPPWRYEEGTAPPSRAVENHYATMTLEDIKRIPVPAADDAVLFLWSPNPKLAEALEVVEAWGFSYRTNVVWTKDRPGCGHWVRQRHELLLIASRGAQGTPHPSRRPDSVLAAPRGRHSAKPAETHRLIEAMYPDAPRVELFARCRRPGWTTWGSEVPGGDPEVPRR